MSWEDCEQQVLATALRMNGQYLQRAITSETEVTELRERVKSLGAQVHTMDEHCNELEARLARVEALTKSDRMPWAIVLADGTTVGDRLHAVLDGEQG